MKHLLLLDDEDVFNFIHHQVIASVDPAVKISETTSGEQALEFLRVRAGLTEALPDVVLVDINMPEINGFEFLTIYEREIEALLPVKPKIYMVTSSLFESDREKAARFKSVSGFLEKPVSAPNIREIMATTENQRK